MYLKLNSLHFKARHGVLPQERVGGGDFLVDLSLEIADTDAHDALCHDALEATVNYAEIYRKVKEEMDIPSALIEHVAGRIARSLISGFPKIAMAQVKVTKCCPPIEGFDGAGATVQYCLRRSLVVWDFDGTVADTSAGIVRTMQATFEKMGWPVPSEEAVRQTIGLPLRAAIPQLARVDGSLLEDALHIYQELFEQLGAVSVRLFPGIADALQRQFDAGYVVAIATSRGHRSVEELCTQLGIRHLFHFIVACEDVQTHKPDPAPVLALQRMAHVKAEDTTVIGDTSFDMEMGAAARAAHLVGVAWGNHSPHKLLAAGADFVAQTAEDL